MVPRRLLRVPPILVALAFLCIGLCVEQTLAQFPPPIPEPYPENRPPRRSPIPGTTERTTRTVPAPDLPAYTGARIFYGHVEKLEPKRLVIIAPGQQIIRFDLFKETKFFHEGKEVKSSTLTAGDEVRVEADSSDKGFFAATRVFIDKKAKRELSTDKQNDSKEDARPKKAGEAEDSVPKTETAGLDLPPLTKEHIPIDGDDPGPPVLRRKTPEEIARAKKEREARSAKTQETEAQPPLATAETTTADFTPPVPTSKGDPLIRRAREHSAAYTERLPNFICRQVVARFQSGLRPDEWDAQDVVEAEVAFEDGQEHYRGIMINNKPVKKKMQELDGSWSVGEFGTVLRNLFDPWTLAEFRYRKMDSSTSPRSKVYWLHVEKSRSSWQANHASRAYVPEYKGSVWIGEEEGRVLRIEMQALNLPIGFPIDKLEMTIQYGMVRIGSREYLVPIHAETLGCVRGTGCGWNKIDFRNYRKFSSESFIFETDSDINFDNKKAPAQDSPAPKKPRP